MQGQIDQGRRDNAAYGQLERKYETLSSDIANANHASSSRCRPPSRRPLNALAGGRASQGTLADLNLMLDRTRVHKEVHEVDAGTRS